ncbi:hypothetical protein IWT25_02328 [Secundilactobacillus pentosiphilus]|uniref:Uncharacterized protein n=1 Tax=Secundilactobacillus pentosiphilus TaxID=1714682 RepID=A0A1Z5IYS0_9LACO|nr:hypothetical protein [Secundilactobacillus pentosiphilus]GAX06980.1 hypothetical protein IWT25_02328 [Secundilactobacillus pentosiphilus]
MNLSIWFHLFIMNLKAGMWIPEQYKYLDYMIENDWIVQLDYPEIDSKRVFRKHTAGSKFEITSIGRKSLFKFNWVLLPIAISLAALIISLIALKTVQ